MTAFTPERLEARVPRYTSYPTAPHFGAAVDSGVYSRWLSEIDRATPVSLYLHVPFCAEMCWYCGCFTKVVKRYEPIRDYAGTLLKEAALVADRTGHGLPVSFVHWGGGSPTMLAADDWQRLMEGLRENFAIAKDAEVAVEMDPRTTNRDYIKALKRAGVTRVSIGVQDFDPEVQMSINRRQPYDMTARVIDWLRDAGIKSINLDLMYGLPHQTTESVLAMVEKALPFRPDRIALFGYAHVPWMKAHQRLIPEHALPDTEARWEQHEAAASALVAAGFDRVGFDHFAHPDDDLAHAGRTGRLSRNFQGYTADGAETLIGLGASAISTLPQGYAQNAAAIRGYAQSIEKNAFATSRGHALDAEDNARRDVINSLMCDMWADVGESCRRYGLPVDALDDGILALAPYALDGLVFIINRHVSVMEHGRPLIRLIAAAFDAYLDGGPAKHSAAV